MDRMNVFTEDKINMAINKAIKKCEECEKETEQKAKKRKP